MNLVCQLDQLALGVVTLSQTERNLPTIANVDARDFSDLACWLIVQIGPISLNVTTPIARAMRGTVGTALIQSTWPEGTK
jgi:hypothetical protein